MSSKYIDPTAIILIIGCTFKQPKILDNTDLYNVSEEDFVEEFHKIVFGSIYNIHLTGSLVNMETIIDYLSVRPKAKAIFDLNKGVDYLVQAADMAHEDTFNYYYQRLKKMTLLRAYDNIGMDMTFLYDPTEILDTKKRQAQEDWLDQHTLADIGIKIDNKIDEIKSKYIDDEIGQGYQAADGIEELVSDLKKHPEVGIPLYGSLINTVTRGARLRKFYLRSGATGTGKSRTMVADACYFACDEIFEPQFDMWIKCGRPQPTIYIATEQDKSEIQTMMLAFVACVNEEHILNGRYDEGEEERVDKAIQVIKRAPLWIEELPDFSLQDVENKIKKHIRDHDIKYVCQTIVMAV